MLSLLKVFFIMIHYKSKIIYRKILWQKIRNVLIFNLAVGVKKRNICVQLGIYTLSYINVVYFKKYVTSVIYVYVY